MSTSVSSENSSDELPNLLFKFVSSDRVLKIIETRQIRFTQPQFLNDPEELHPIVSPYLALDRVKANIRREAEVSDEELTTKAQKLLLAAVRGAVDHIKEERSKLGILSLTRAPQNVLMWAHYGDSFRGAALGLRAFNSDLMAYSHPTKGPKHACMAEAVQYSDTRKEFFELDSHPMFHLIHKNSHWAYEREWRIVRDLATLKRVSGDVYVAEMRPETIRCIIFGAQMPREVERQITERLRAASDLQHVRIFKSLLSATHYKMDFVSELDYLFELDDRDPTYVNAEEFDRWVPRADLFKALGLIPKDAPIADDPVPDFDRF